MIPIELLERRNFFAAVTVNINTAQTLQTMEGMGAAMIPWQLRPEYTDPAFFDRIVNDLGASMARAAILPMAEPVNDNNDPNTFNWAGFDSDMLGAPFSFFQQLKQRGVDRFVGSVWTAPAWMKTNQIYTDGGALRPDARAEFAEYLSAVTKMAQTDYGINLMAVSLQNEPYFVEPYESTTYNAEQLREALRAVMRKFNQDGVATKILLPEDLIFEDRVGWYLSRIMSDPETKNFKGAFAGHGLTGHWPEIRDTLAPYGRQFWMTETSGTSNTWEGAMGLGNSIMNAIGTANASTYLYWQFSEKAGNEKYALMSEGLPTLKYYAAKQFYRYIRPGMVHVASAGTMDDQVRVASFKNPSTGAMTTVILNRDGDTHDVTFNFAGTGLPGSYKVFRSSGAQQWQSLGNITGGSSFAMTIPGLTITTITNVPELTPKTGGAMPTDVTIQKVSDFVSKNNFFKASMKGYTESLTAQIAGGKDVNQVAPNGWTPLHSAAGSANAGSLGTTQLLIDHGANVNAVNNEGWTPLHAAAANTFSKFGSSPTLVVDKINALLNAGANVNAKDINGRTALHWAAWLGKGAKFTEDSSIVDALLARGANPFTKDNFGKTALDYALAEGYDRVGDALIKAMGTDTTKPTADVVNISPDPRSTSVTDILINFSERVKGFDMTDLELTRNGSLLPLPVPELLTTSDDIHFKISGLGGLTAAPGTYVLTIKAAGSSITDPSDNPLAGDASDTWVLTNSPPPPPPPPGVQSPFKGTPFAIGATASIIEFEDFDNGGEGTAYHDADTTNQGAGYRDTGVDLKAVQNDIGAYYLGYTKAGEWTEYTINVASAGSYDLDFRIASTNTGGTFHLEVDGANVTGALTIPNTTGWQTWKTFTKTGVNLPSGQHVLRLAMDALGPSGAIGNFNYVSIKPSGGSPPPPPPPPPVQTPFKGSPFAITTSAATTIEAEDFDNGDEGVAYHDSDAANNGGASYRTSGVDIQASGDSGGGYNVGYTKAGEWLEYTINVASAGTYDFAIRSASTGTNAKIRFTLDGTDITGPITLPSTGGWQTFATTTKTGVTLPAGEHVLRLAMDTVGSTNAIANINWLKISPANPPAGTTLTSTTSTYTRGGASAALNFGSDASLIAKKHSDPSSSREAFIKFDLTSIATINSAKLRLFGSLNDTSSTSVQTQVFGGAATPVWDENTLTWNTRPATVGGALSTVTVAGTTKQWYELDVSSFLKSEKSLGRNIVTLVLKNPTQQNALVVFNSDDAATNKPQLVIN